MGFLKKRINKLFNQKVDDIYNKACAIVSFADLKKAFLKEYCNSEFYEIDDGHVREIDEIEASLIHLKPIARELTIQSYEFEKENKLNGIFGRKKSSSDDYMANVSSLAKVLMMNNKLNEAEEKLTYIKSEYTQLSSSKKKTTANA